MGFKRLYHWFTNMSSKIDEYDGRTVAPVPFKEELTENQRVARARNETISHAAADYLTKRGRHMLTSPGFKYVTAENTDIRATMRRYIEETMPEAKETYRFLFVE